MCGLERSAVADVSRQEEILLDAGADIETRNWTRLISIRLRPGEKNSSSGARDEPQPTGPIRSTQFEEVASFQSQF